MRGGLQILMRTARQLSALVRQADRVVDEALAAGAAPGVVAGARMMRSQLVSTKTAVEDELVAWVLDCRRCGLRMHWVVGEGAELGHWPPRQAGS